MKKINIKIEVKMGITLFLTLCLQPLFLCVVSSRMAAAVSLGSAWGLKYH
jgi:hypothetical protein